jgi:hypothetical protein
MAKLPKVKAPRMKMPKVKAPRYRVPKVKKPKKIKLPRIKI